MSGSDHSIKCCTCQASPRARGCPGTRRADHRRPTGVATLTTLLGDGIDFEASSVAVGRRSRSPLPTSGGHGAMKRSSRRGTMSSLVTLAPATFLLAAVAAAADDPARRFDAGGDPAYRPVEAAAPQPLDGGGLRSPEELEAFVDGFVGGELEAYDVAGLTVAVVKDGRLFFAKGYGWADVDRRIPVDADNTPFRPGSVSKLVTWTAVMQLVERGKLDLDADVNTYLTQFKIPASYPAPITLRHVL